MSEDRVFVFITYSKYEPWDDKLPPNGRGQGHVTHLKF